MTPIFILGGAQTDFATNWTQQGKSLYDLLSASITAALDQTNLPPDDVQVAHVGNFTAELFAERNRAERDLSVIRGAAEDYDRAAKAAGQP